MRLNPSRLRRLALAATACALLTPFTVADSHQPTVSELKEKISEAGLADRVPLCIQLSELQLREADRLYRSGDSQHAKAALTDVATFAELARDYSIQTRKHEKKSEIAVRKMVRKLTDLKHSVAFDDQAEVQSTIDRLQRVRDDLLAAMFPEGNKK